MEAARRAVAEDVAHCRPEDVVVVDNLTVASTMVAAWLVEDVRLAAAPRHTDNFDKFEQSVVLICNVTYGAVAKAMRWARNHGLTSLSSIFELITEVGNVGN